ncbi:MAG: polysaccharide biosynthesis/export family protein [Bacteroidota bacterium]|nr:polysaccharide biosynthesis/export family protein [Bacteroidota bacterium]
MAKSTLKHLLFPILIVFSVFIASCISQKKVSYFQPTDKINDTVSSDVILKYTHRLRAGDIINVGVSSISPEANTMFNPYSILQQFSYQNTQANNLSPAIGYMIDDEGAISIPMVGKIIVAGLNTKEASDLIVQKLEKYLINPTVNVRILNYSVSVLGEVARPSVYNIPNERVTLPEVLSLAGDLTIYANRNNVLIIREKNGKREFARVDLTKRDVFNSPFYYLQPNDVIYVEPGVGKTTSTDRTVLLAPTILSGLSLITVILTYIKFK